MLIRVAIAVALLAGCKSDPSPSPSPSPSPTPAPPAPPAPPPPKPPPKPHDPTTPHVIELGLSIDGVKLGMTRAQVEALGFTLAPQDIKSSDHTGWIAEPSLTGVFDASGLVSVVAVDLAKSPGVVIDGHAIGPHATLVEIGNVIPGCRASSNSAGNALSCIEERRWLHLYDSPGSPDVTIVQDVPLPAPPP